MENEQKKEAKKREWADVNEQLKFVIHGGRVLCPFCVPPMADIIVTSSTIMMQDKPWASVKDKDGKVNFNFTGVCTHPSQQKPFAPPPPCKAVINLGEWKKFSDTMVGDNNALLVKSTIPCMISGQDLTIIDSGQKATLEKMEPMVKKELILSVEKEYIIVVGTQSYSSSFWRNMLLQGVGSNSKLMFVHQALRRLKLNADIQFTVLICQRDYTQKQLNIIKDTVENLYKGTCIQVSSAAQIVNYINARNDVSDLKKKKKIKQLLFYSHGVVGQISLGLAPAGFDLTEYSFGEAQVKELKEEAFYSNAHIYSFACRTGLGNPKIDESIYINDKKDKNDPKNIYNFLSHESLAQKIANQTKSIVYAYLKRTWYGDTLFTDDEYDFMDACDAYIKKTTPERSEVKSGNKYNDIIKNGLSEDDIKRYKELQKINKEIVVIDKAKFLAQGALHPVRAADTPIGLPADMKTYKKT